MCDLLARAMFSLAVKLQLNISWMDNVVNMYLIKPLYLEINIEISSELTKSKASILGIEYDAKSVENIRAAS